MSGFITFYAFNLPTRYSLTQMQPNQISSSSSPTTRRKALSLFTLTTFFSGLAFSHSCPSNYSWSKPKITDFVELPNSGGVKALDLRVGDGGETPFNGDKVAIHYYGRLAAKQGWRFDSTYDHKDETGEPIPFEFVLGSGKVISGIESAVRSMRVGGIRRIVIPPSQGYQNTSQEPIPPNVEYPDTGNVYIPNGVTGLGSAEPPAEVEDPKCSDVQWYI